MLAGIIIGLVVGISMTCLGIFGLVSPAKAAEANDSDKPLGGAPASGAFGPTTLGRARAMGVGSLVIGAAIIIISALALMGRH